MQSGILYESNEIHQERQAPSEVPVGQAVFLNPFDIPEDYNFSNMNLLTEQDCEDLFLTVVGMYDEDKVTFDNAAERFLQRARVIQSSAAFHGLMEQAARIEAHIHQMCGENQGMQDAYNRQSQSTHGENDGHNHKQKDEKEMQHQKNCASEKGGRCDCK